MDGLEMFLSWQALVGAAIVITVTGGVKAVINLAFKGWKDNRIMARIVMPAMPLVLGALGGALIPVRPEAVVEYVAEHTSGFSSTLAYAAWGFVAFGVAGAWLFDRFKDFLAHGKD